jgi:hypothetical protein
MNSCDWDHHGPQRTDEQLQAERDEANPGTRPCRRTHTLAAKTESHEQTTEAKTGNRRQCHRNREKTGLSASRERETRPKTNQSKEIDAEKNRIQSPAGRKNQPATGDEEDTGVRPENRNSRAGTRYCWRQKKLTRVSGRRQDVDIQAGALYRERESGAWENQLEVVHTDENRQTNMRTPTRERNLGHWRSMCPSGKINAWRRDSAAKIRCRHGKHEQKTEFSITALTSFLLEMKIELIDTLILIK